MKTKVFIVLTVLTGLLAFGLFNACNNSTPTQPKQQPAVQQQKPAAQPTAETPTTSDGKSTKETATKKLDDKGESAGVPSTNPPPPGCTSGTGVVTVTGNGGSCVAGTPPSGNGPYNWEVAEGGSYTMTITGVTECPGNTITVFVQGSHTGNFCFNATGGSGTYTGTFTMPSPACFTYPISYKCGADQSCDNSNTFDARGPDGACTVHLRASIFDGSCTKTGDDENCGCTECTLTCPDNVTVECGGSTDPADTGTPGGCANATPSDQVTPGDCPQEYTITRTWSAPNGCGGTASCVQTITVVDTHAPVLNGCPEDASYQCYSQVPPPATVTATDNCDTDVPVVFNEEQSNPGSNCNNTITRTWTATDACENTASCTQTITVNDNTAPVLANVPTGRDLGCNPTPPSCATNVTATDNCDGSVEVHCNAGNVTGPDCNKSQTFTYSAQDACGNTVSQDVTYTWKEDTTPPVISCSADGSSATALDNCDGEVTPTLVSTEVQKNTPCFGKNTITRKWTATDACGNTSSQTSCVQVTGECVPGCSYTVGAYKGTGAPSAYVPSSLTVGVGYTLTFNSKLAIQKYLKIATGTPGQLTSSAIDPTTLHGEGIFGGQIVALKINVSGGLVPNPIGSFHLCDVTTSLLSSKGQTLTAAQAAALEGKTVSQILANAEVVLGGGSLLINGSTESLSVSQWNALVTLLNESFDNCVSSSWALTYMCCCP